MNKKTLTFLFTVSLTTSVTLFATSSETEFNNLLDHQIYLKTHMEKLSTRIYDLLKKEKELKRQRSEEDIEAAVAHEIQRQERQAFSIIRQLS